MLGLLCRRPSRFASPLSGLPHYALHRTTIPDPMPFQGPVAPRVSERFVVRHAEEIGFPVPPVPLRLKLVEATQHWSLFVQPMPAAPWHGIAQWLAPFAPLRLELGSRHVVRADFDPLPAAWSIIFRGIDLDAVELGTDGRAVVNASGSRAALRAFTRRVRESAQMPLDIRHVSIAPEPSHLLTSAQDQALRAAAAAGYYRVPRPLSLRDLAQKLHVSSASLSERLRRAEGRVILRYVNEGARSPWDARTLFEARPLVSFDHEDSIEHDKAPIAHVDARERLDA